MTDQSAAGDELVDLYRELILDHARSPRHFGPLPRATHSAEGINPLCGDKLKLELTVNDDETIVDAGFEGTGCAISVASASLLTDTVTGLPVKDALSIYRALIDTLTGSAETSGNARQSSTDLGKLHALEGVREFPSRVKCATLAWHALDAAIHRSQTPASTE